MPDWRIFTALGLEVLAGRAHLSALPDYGESNERSDQGSQYASGDFQKQRVTFRMRGSMRRKGDCWDNAVTETRFGSLKVKRLHGMHFATRRQGKPFDRLRKGDRLVFVLRSPEPARDAGISRPAGLRGTTACRSRKARRIIAQLRGR
jgi:hypothetical protein